MRGGREMPTRTAAKPPKTGIFLTARGSLPHSPATGRGEGSAPWTNRPTSDPQPTAAQKRCKGSDHDHNHTTEHEGQELKVIRAEDDTPDNGPDEGLSRGGGRSLPDDPGGTG